MVAIELIRFKEYYGMLSGHEHDPLYSHSIRNNYGLSVYISREKGNHYYILTRHKDLFSNYNLILRNFEKKCPERYL